MCGLHQEPGRDPLHCGRQQPDPLHPGLPQEICPALLSLSAAHHAHQGPGGDGEGGRPGQELPRGLLQVCGLQPPAEQRGGGEGLLPPGQRCPLQGLQHQEDPGSDLQDLS